MPQFISCCLLEELGWCVGMIEKVSTYTSWWVPLNINGIVSLGLIWMWLYQLASLRWHHSSSLAVQLATHIYINKKKKSWKPQNPTNISQQLSEDKNDEQLRGNLKGAKTKLRWNPVPCDPLAIHFLLGAALSLRTTWRVQSKHGTLKDLLSP